MKIIHRIGVGGQGPIRTELQRLGYELKDGCGALHVEESDSRWPKVDELVKKYAKLDMVTTKFSPSEIASAKFLTLVPEWHHGYPQPDGGFAYEAVTYDGIAGCSDCGCLKRQIAPFRFKREPKWGRRSILQLNWVFDEYFVIPDVWEEVFRPLGIGALEVLHAKTEMPLKTVVQLDIPREDVELHLPTYEFQQCDLCTTKKYLPISRGFFPSFTGKSNSALFRSREFFGSGGSAFNEIFVTQSLCRAMRERKLRGVRFKPVALGESL